MGLRPNYIFDDMLFHLSQEISDSDSDLPDADFKIGSGWFAVNAYLKNGELEGLSNFTRQGDSCLSFTAGDMNIVMSGTARLTDLKAEYTAKVSGVSKDVSGTVDYADFAVTAAMTDADACKFDLTQCDITVGNINVSIGSGWLDSVISSFVTKATNKVSDYLINVFEEVVRNAIQDYMDNELDLTDFCDGYIILG